MRSRSHIGHVRRTGSILRRPGDQLLGWGPVDFSNGLPKPPPPSAAEQAEHAGRTPQPGVPAGPRNTEQPSASGYEYSQETYEANPSLTPPAPARVERRRTPFPSQAKPIAAPSFTPTLPGQFTPLVPGGAAEQSPLQTLLEGAGGALAGRPGGLLSALDPSPQTAAQAPAPPKVPAPPKAPALTYQQFNESLGLKRQDSAVGPTTWIDPSDKADPAHWVEKTGKLDQLREQYGNDRVSRWAAGKGTLPIQAATPGRAAADQNPATAFISSKRGAVPNPADPLGAKSLGNVTAAELASAQKAGGLRINKRGVLITPEQQEIRRNLVEARQAVAKSGPNLQQLHKAYPHISLSVLKGYRAAVNQTGVPAALLAGIEGQESNYGASELPGVRSGSNFAGASGPFQIGTGGGAAGDWWHENMPAGMDPYDDVDAAVAAGKYLTDAGATKDPSTWYDAAYSYNHADWYAEEAVKLAGEHKKLEKLGLPPNPKATEALAVAKREARAAGQNPTPWNGDVDGGGEDFTWVKADAKGMLDWAESALGDTEGTPKVQKWADRFALGNSTTEPWCANFISNGLLRRGFGEDMLPGNKNYVPSYEEWAQEGKYATDLGTDLSKAKPGDLLAFSGEHIGVYKGDGLMVSGNSSDAVSKTAVADEGFPLTAIIRPKYKGGKVKVADSEITGSNVESGLGSVGGSESSSGSTGAPGAPGGGEEGGSVLAGNQAPFIQQPPIAAPAYSAPGPVVPDVAPGTTEGEEILRALTQGRGGAVLQ